MPDESNQLISPWIAVYLGLAILATGVTLWRFQMFAKKYAVEAEHLVYAQLDSGMGPTVFQPLGHQAV
jgi:hypothetical protein